MIVFRLSKAAFSNDLSGKGAEKSGGRWNSKGVAIVYTSASRALCTTEIAVHTPLGNLPSDYKLISIEIPDDVIILEISLGELPSDWKSVPHSHSTQQIGDQFILANNFVVLKVPSVIVQDEFNYLLNPELIKINNIQVTDIQSFDFDTRLFSR
ncbi:MAG: RES family NAD+ phosphorylase [Bacteroidales bacterium]